MKKYIYQKAISALIIILIGSQSISPVLAAQPVEIPKLSASKAAPQYNQLMRDLDKTIDFTVAENTFYKTVLQNLPEKIKQEKYQASKDHVSEELETFIESEKEKLKDSKIAEEKKEQYLERLDKQLKIVKGEEAPPLNQKKDIVIPPKPSVFQIDKTEEEIKEVKNVLIDRKLDPGLIEKTFQKFQLIPAAKAYVDNYMPVIEDLGEDGREIIINSEIRALAQELDQNPVKIFNFVRNNIDYEPYFGAKKNSVDCLREAVCNDVDTSALTIALMRASGIPAHYKKSLAIVEKDQLRELLGVTEEETIFKAMQAPLFTLAGFEDKLALEWTHVEIFYPYDERLANFSSPYQQGFEDQVAMRDHLREFKDNQWLPVDAAMKSYQHLEKEILNDRANFNTENFWRNYLQYQGDLSPTEKYLEEIAQASGQDPNDATFHTEKELIQKEFDFLPYTLPYLVGQGSIDGNQINIEDYSVLPENYRHQVRISLLNADDQAEVFSHTFYFTEVNNQAIELHYQGFDEVDEQTIVEHGGIHATPADLVEIKPLLIVDNQQFFGEQPLTIGQNLFLQFEYLEEEPVVDQKFSVAGNSEGIYMYFSKLQNDALLDDLEDPDRNSKILLEGNAMIAREYLRNVEENTEKIKKYLDYDFDVAAYRAVVTQNRILNELDDVATTFEFKGLGIDSSLYGNGYSNRGALDNHADDFSLLWLLYASHQEAKVFENLTSLDAISTVSGLQYAYANPDQYQVHTISAANQALIDNLEFSANTKANMHADIAAGATIITPNRPVHKQNWQGTLYISRNPNGTDKYAIGEQAEGNGADTTDPVYVEHEEKEVAIYHWVEEENTSSEVYYAFEPAATINVIEYVYYSTSDVRKTLVYQDGQKYVPGMVVHNLMCSIPEQIHNQWVNRDGWEDEWGAPCYKPGGFAANNQPDSLETTRFLENNGFISILTTNGIKFYSPSYELPGHSYWISFDDLLGGYSDYIYQSRSLNSNHLNWLSSGGYKSSKYSSILGSYFWSICESGTVDKNNRCNNPNADAAVYYLPTDDGGDYFRVKPTIFDKLAEKNNLPISRLGLPVSDEGRADDSESISGAFQQRFIRGTAYRIPTEYELAPHQKIFSTPYTYGPMDQKHRNLGGTDGPLGFPTGDLVDDYAAGKGKVYQFFENDKVLLWNLNAGNGTNAVTVTDSDNPAGIEKADCELYGDVESEIRLAGFFIQGMADVGIEGVGDLASLIWNSFELISHPSQLKNYILELFDEIKNVDWKRLVEEIGVSTEQYFDDLESDLSSCSAKVLYTNGKLTGLAMTVVFGGGAGIKLITKIRLVKNFSKILKTKAFSSSILNFIASKTGKTSWFSLKKTEDASIINKIHTDYRASKSPEGLNFAPYKSNVPVFTLKLERSINDQFVRVFADGGVINKHFIMHKKAITNPQTGSFLSAVEIRDKFALPSLPNRVVDVNLPKGTELRFGIVNNQTLANGAHLGGGGEQFEIITNGLNVDPPAPWFPEDTIRPL